MFYGSRASDVEDEEPRSVVALLCGSDRERFERVSQGNRRCACGVGCLVR